MAIKYNHSQEMVESKTSDFQGDSLFSERKMGEILIGKQFRLTSEWFQAKIILYRGGFGHHFLKMCSWSRKNINSLHLWLTDWRFGKGKENKCKSDCLRRKSREILISQILIPSQDGKISET